MTVIAVYLQRNGDIQQISKIAYDFFFGSLGSVAISWMGFFSLGSVAAP